MLASKSIQSKGGDLQLGEKSGAAFVHSFLAGDGEPDRLESYKQDVRRWSEEYNTTYEKK